MTPSGGKTLDETAKLDDRRRGKVDPKLLELLVCPLTKTGLEYDAEAQELISRAARLAYPIRDGIPIMLPDEARPLE
ncbi:MAG: Trm112 family protein [Hyphomicrobiaceae bacterium]|nr:Trm112 family protein [Hyphomicrobiaceae bacterium]